MITRLGTGWQTIMADLSMILFMITASVLSNAPEDAPRRAPAPAVPVSASPRAEPVSLWSEGADAPPLAAWLAQQPADPRVRVTVLVRYARKGRDAAMGHARALADAAGERGRSARVLVEPGATDGATVTLAYDSDSQT